MRTAFRALRVFELKTPSSALRAALLAALLCWVGAALLFLATAEGSLLRAPAALFAYWTAAAFATAATAGILLRPGLGRAGRSFWGLMGGGLLLRFAANLSPDGSQPFDLVPPFVATRDAAYAASYLLLFLALLWLITLTTRNATFVAGLDSFVVMLSVGLLTWYFVLGPAAAEAGLEDWPGVVLALSGTVCDAGLLCLALVAVSSEDKPLWTFALGGAFVALLIADGLQLRLLCLGYYDEAGGWPELVRALGVGLFGLAALRANSSSSTCGFVRQLGTNPGAVFAFWFGPLSPAMQYAFLLLWSALRLSPLPLYLIGWGALLAVYFAFRISLASYLSRELRREAERMAARMEQSRISEELHDSLKQSVSSVPLVLGACRESLRKREIGVSEDLLDQALEVSREIHYQISRPIGELKALCREPSTLNPRALFEQLLEDVRRHFGPIEVHEDLRASLEELDSEELAAAYRIVGEALYNSAKHAEAKNVWLGSRREGTALLVEVGDDGRGFSTKDPPAGFGLPSMRARARRVGAELGISSESGRGTTVELRIEKRRVEKR